MTFNDLLSNGFQEYKGNKGDRFCQKAICSGGKKLYFLNVYLYVIDSKENISVESEMYREEDWMRVCLHECETKTIFYIESFFQQVYKLLNCCPDIHNND